jgi:hypothetical protein
MKKILLIAFIAFPYLGYCQLLPTLSKISIDSVSALITYKSITKKPKLSEDQLYSRLRAWVATAYNSANDVIQMDDKTSGIMIAKGIFSYPNMRYPILIHYTLTISIKPEKYRIVITDYALQIVGGEATVALEQTYRSCNASKYAISEIDYNNLAQLIYMLNDIDFKSNEIIKSINIFMAQGIKDDF